MAPTMSRGIVIEADQDEQVRALISRGLNYSDFVQAATDILLSGKLAKYGGMTPGESLRRALDRAEDAERMALFIEAVQELRDDQGLIDPDLWDELRGDLLRGEKPGWSWQS